jgi:gluconate 2-dehydrogenase alpha chain
MAIDLKKTDVVIVGLGAVGGVAALPLARAGLDVVGLEAGSWLTARDFAPDELRNNFRGWPQAAQKANGEIPTHRPNASAPYSPRLPIHPMMNAVGGTSLHYWAQLAPQSVGLQGGKRDDAALRRLAHPPGLDGRGLAVRA